MNNEMPDFDKMWNYSDHRGTRAKFTDILTAAEIDGDKSYELQLRTQLARTWSLDMGYDEAHKILDTVETQLNDDLPLVRVRYLLERGQTFRSSGKPEKALPLFRESYELARQIRADFFAIDAAHMVSLAEKDTTEKRKWNLVAMKVAEQSDDEKARGWLGSLYNNMGWDYHDEGKFDDALEMFNKALDFRKEKGDAKTIGIAKWCVARAYRSLNRIDDALSMQLDLLAEYEKQDRKDGYVYEELGELYLIQKNQEKSRKYFELAHAELTKDAWLVKNEVERLQRIKRLSSDN